MSYTPQTWTDNDPTTPLSGARLTHMETGIAGADAAATAAAAAAAAEATARSSAIAAEAAARDTAITTAVNALLNGAPGALDTLKELADAINDDASFAATVTTALAGKAPISTTTIDLVDRTNNTTETVPAGTTTNCSTAGVTKTAPALAGTVGTPPLRFAVKNISTGSITVAYPDQAGTAQSLTMLTGETRTFRQKSTSGWGVESGALALSTLDGRFAPITGSAAYAPLGPTKIAGPVTSRAYPAAFSAALSNGTDTSGNTRSAHPCVYGASRLRVVYGNFQATAAIESDGLNSETIRCAIEYPAGTYTPVYFNGKRDVTLDPGARVESSWCPVTVPAGATFWVRTFVTVTSGGKWVGMDQKSTTLGEGWLSSTSAADLTTSGTITAGTFTGTGRTPYSVHSELSPLLPRLFVEGDSITAGANDVADPPGWLGRGVTTVPFQRAAISSAKLVNASWRYLSLAAGCNVYLDGYGRNDITSGTSAATLQALLLARWTVALGQGMKTWQVTVTPLSTSTDSWTTLAGQTAETHDPARQTVNAWLRAGAPIDPGTKAAVAVGTSGALLTTQTGHPLTGGVVDLAAAVESGTTGKYNVAAGRTVTDAAITTGTAVLTSATAAFVAGDKDSYVRVVGAGAASADLFARIATVTNGTTVSLATNAGTTVSAATAAIGYALTMDGTHPSPAGYALMGVAAAAAVPSLSVLTL